MDIKQTQLAPARWSTRQAAVKALAVPATLLIVGALGLAQAATNPPAAAPAGTTGSAVAKSGDATDAVLKFSQAGHDAFASIRKARTDLFNGQTDAATTEMKAAQMSLIAAKAEAPSFATTTQTKVMGKVVGTQKDLFKADAVPVGGDLVLADNFQLSEQHRPVMAKANEQLAKGNKKAAVEVLKQGNVDVSYSRQWLPLASAEKNLDKAITLASSKHYYEANLALKAIEDTVQTDIVSFDTAPAAS